MFVASPIPIKKVPVSRIKPVTSCTRPPRNYYKPVDKPIQSLANGLCGVPVSDEEMVYTNNLTLSCPNVVGKVCISTRPR